MKLHNRLLALAMSVLTAFGGAISGAIPQEGDVAQAKVESEEVFDIPNTALMTNEELFAGYIDQLLNPKGDFAFWRGASAESNLSEMESKWYEAIKKHIVAIANGTEHNTQFEIKLSEVLNSTDTLRYTSSDLGLGDDKALFKLNGNTYSLTSEASTAFYQKTGFSAIQKARDALLFDCPYELYWFNKTVNNSTEYSLNP